jgi:GDP-4-dehydro-6-deoxy-D-mannose reductase
MTQRILVTGAGGFLGRHFCEYLAGQPVEVHTLSRTRLPGLPNHTAAPDDSAALARVLAEVKPDGVLHLAGTTAGGFSGCLRVNTLYAAALIDALQSAGLSDRPLLLVGSAAEIGPLSPDELPATEDAPTRPASPYGASKLAQTDLGLAAARGGRPVIIVRISNLLGAGLPGNLAPARFAAQLAALKAEGKTGGVISAGALETVRDYIDVTDASRLAWRLFNHSAARGRLINLCSGAGTTTGELLDRFIRCSGLQVEVRRDSGPPAGVPAHVGSTALLEELVGPLALRPLDESLSLLWEAALAGYNRPP